ncbi:MAG: cation-translocating P-type ATPase, partial [Labilithrix sp.]|nr:cation-translocating P-type ATPase [Labilithrix sp.]
DDARAAPSDDARGTPSDDARADDARGAPSDDDADADDGADERRGDPSAEESPSTLRSPSVTDVEPADPPSRRDLDASARARLGSPMRLGAVAPVVGTFAGVLASVVSLAGASAGVLRLPLALAAAAVVLAHRALAPREHSEPSRWVVLGPIAAASIVATISAVVHDAHAAAHASFVGLAAAAVSIVDVLLSRARRDVLAARARTRRGLAVGARVVRGDGVVEVDAALVKPGEQVIVEAGETIPVDGILVAGSAAEVAPWLDSPLLVQKGEGDAVVAGAVVVSGLVRVNATFSGAERAWLRLTQAASSRPDAGASTIEAAAPLVAFVRRFVERGAPAAGVLVGGAVYANNGSWLDVAIAACGGGHALAAAAGVSAAALAHARGHAAAQRRGIVYKDADAFDAAARADVAVVCSRGTILLGEPEIVAVEGITKDGASAKSDVARVLAIAAGAEMSSTHPFASAILREARAREVRPDNMRSALGHSGLGVTALAANGDRVIVGSRAFLLQERVSVAIADARTSELEAEGRSVLLVAVGGRLVGLLALQDGLRPGARAAVQRLHDARIEPVLLSGEARETSETIARALDIEHVRPEILPADRGAEVRALSDGGRIVAALGHASTDDGALGAADVSVAMEAAGSAPGEWGVALASDDVRDATLSLTIPRACRDRARVALVVSGLTQALGALGIGFGVAPPAVVPVLGVLAAAAVVSIVREPAVVPD